MPFVEHSLNPLQACLLFAVSIACFSIFLAIYRLFFHPLREYPGPLLSRVSQIPVLVARLQGNEPRHVHELHQKYGAVVRIAPTELSYINPEGWKDIFGHKAQGRDGMIKDPRLTINSLGGTDSILSASHDDHSRQRRLISHAFSDKAMREQEPLIQEHVSLLNSRLTSLVSAAGGSKTLDMTDWYTFVTFDIIADLAFGEDFGMVKTGKSTAWMDATFGAIKAGVISGALMQFAPTALQSFFARFTPQEVIDAGNLHVAESERRVNERLARQTDKPDVWKFVLRNDEKDAKRQLSLAEKHALGKTLIVAGTETTATLLAGMSHQLTRNPDKLERLVRELRSKFKTAADINMTELAEMPYLHAVIEESMRLYPSIQVGLQRIVPKGGRVIVDKFVPEGTNVSVSHYSAYRSEVNFAHPLEFAPDRWMPDMPDKRFENDRREVLQPFGIGPRNCIGRNLAYHEARMIFANVLWHFDLQATPGHENWLDQKIYGINGKGPLMLQLTLAPHLKEKRP